MKKLRQFLPECRILGRQNINLVTFDIKHTDEAKKKISKSIKGKTTVCKGKTWKIVSGKRVWINKKE